MPGGMTADRLVPARPVRATVPTKSMRGLVWFLKNVISMSLISFCRRNRRNSGRLSRAAFNASVKIHRSRIKLRRVSRRKLRRPFRTRWLLEDQDLQIVFSNRDVSESRSATQSRDWQASVCTSALSSGAFAPAAICASTFRRLSRERFRFASWFC